MKTHGTEGVNLPKQATETHYYLVTSPYRTIIVYS